MVSENMDIIRDEGGRYHLPSFALQLASVPGEFHLFELFDLKDGMLVYPVQ
jgi:hypothetical protein